MDMIVNKGYNFFLNSCILLLNDFLCSRIVSYYGSKKFIEKLYVFVICIFKKIILNFFLFNVKVVRIFLVICIVFMLYVIFLVNMFFLKMILYIFIIVLLI